MPPKTRARKVLKENNVKANHKTKSKTDNVCKVIRKPLADKTNSASDENVSLDVTRNRKMPTKQSTKTPNENKTRPRRDRKVPTRFIESASENKELGNQSLEKITTVTSHTILDKSNVSQKSNNNLKKSPFKSPQEVGNTSLLDHRPKRVHRLPSRFDDHSVSPSKFVPVTPCFASTPIVQKQKSNVKKADVIPESSVKQNETIDKKASPISRRPKSRTVSKPFESDGNNNPKKEKQLRTRQFTNKKTSPEKTPQKQEKRLVNKICRQVTTKKARPENQEKRLINKSYSFRVLEEKSQSPKKSLDKLAVYEFTFDPAEEPPPQKKKKKRVIRKKAPPKPKVTFFKNNYEANISKTLQDLKQAVCKTPAPTLQSESTATQTVDQQAPLPSTNTDTEHINNNAATEVHDQINYSPVASPASNQPQIKMSTINETRDLLYNRARSTMHPEHLPRDPLNLLEELSFCDEPIASSSMNTSVRHPLASPWRAEFNNLPLKWRDNTYVKPNMTPAVECSLINSFNSQKKHIYTNLVPETAETLPEIVTNDNTTNWKQTSILSFIKEVVEKNEQKKLKAQNKATPKKTATPNRSGHSSSNDNITNENNLFCDIVNTSDNMNEEERPVTKKTPSKRKNETPVSEIPTKSPRVELKDTENFFGFDESEDQENISPQMKVNEKAHSLRSRSRAVLKEINAVTGPSRAKIPLAAKSKLAPSSDVMNKMFDNMMSATDAPEFTGETEAAVKNHKEVSSVNDPSWRESMEHDDEENSVHLFEDIDFVHHLKPTRKSYGNCKKVTFMQKTADTHFENSSDENDNEDDDSNDLPFEMPTVKTRKAAPKKKKGPKFTKKEEDEVEAWAAAFNSMCEDVDQFPLQLE